MLHDLAVNIGVRAGISLAAALIVFFWLWSPLLAIVVACVSPFLTKRPAKYIADKIISSRKIVDA